MVGADFGADDWKNISPAAVEHHALYEAAATHGGILILHDSHMRTAMALDDLITTFEQDGYHFVQLVPPPGAQPPGDLKAAGPILGSTAAADGRDGLGNPPALWDQVTAHLKDWGARIATFGQWLGGALGQFWEDAMAQLNH